MMLSWYKVCICMKVVVLCLYGMIQTINNRESLPGEFGSWNSPNLPLVFISGHGKLSSKVLGIILKTNKRIIRMACSLTVFALPCVVEPPLPL